MKTSNYKFVWIIVFYKSFFDKYIQTNRIFLDYQEMKPFSLKINSENGTIKSLSSTPSPRISSFSLNTVLQPSHTFTQANTEDYYEEDDFLRSRSCSGSIELTSLTRHYSYDQRSSTSTQNSSLNAELTPTNQKGIRNSTRLSQIRIERNEQEASHEQSNKKKAKVILPQSNSLKQQESLVAESSNMINLSSTTSNNSFNTDSLIEVKKDKCSKISDIDELVNPSPVKRIATSFRNIL